MQQAYQSESWQVLYLQEEETYLIPLCKKVMETDWVVGLRKV